MKPFDVVSWNENKIKIINQTKLPNILEYLHIDTPKKLWYAIKELKVRGAPAIGIAGAFGVALAASKFKGNNKNAFQKYVLKTSDYIASSRPTAVNLFWAIDRMKKVLTDNSHKNISELKKCLLKEALVVLEEDKKICRAIGKFGASLIKNGDVILTHCNAGALATGDYGTAIGVIYSAVDDGKKIKVFADETRPLLQGARLSAWELMQHNVDVTLICDNMAASIIKKGWISKIIVGADRIASNGDTANKIGTYNLAVLAKYHKIPFYIAAPLSTFDFSIKNGDQIPIETRAEHEVTSIYGKRVAPIGVKVYNPAFDVTPHNLITAFITEKGVFKDTKRIITKLS